MTIQDETQGEPGPVRTEGDTMSEHDRESIERMKAMLDSGKWPSGLHISIPERRVITENIERLQRRAKP